MASHLDEEWEYDIPNNEEITDEWEMEPSWRDKLPTLNLTPEGKATARLVKGAASLHPLSLAFQIYDLLPQSIKENILSSGFKSFLPEEAKKQLAEAAAVQPSDEISQAYNKLFGLSSEPETELEKNAERIGEYTSLFSPSGWRKAIAKGLGLAAGEDVVEKTLGPEFAQGFKVSAPLGVAAASFLGNKPQTALQTAVESNPEMRRRYNYGRSLGLTEEEMTPLLQPHKKQALLEPLTKESRRGQEAFNKSREALGRNYRRLHAEGAKISVPQQATNKLFNRLQEFNSEITSPHLLGPDSQAVATRVQQGIESIANNPGNVDQLISTYRELNSIPNWNTMTDGRRRLSQMRDMFMDAIKESNPRIGKELEMTNSLYQNLMNNAQALSVNTRPVIHNGMNINPILFGLGFGGIEGGIQATKGVLAHMGLNRIATELLVNPRLQGLHRNILRAINQSNPALKIKVFNDALQWLKKDFPEDYEILNKHQES